MSEKLRGLNSMEKILFLSSMLHDIGKFWQRTGDQNIKKILKREYEDIYKGENAYSPRHQEWGAYFCERFIGIDDVTLTVRNHHRPSSTAEYIIQAADRLSSGERIDTDDDEKGKQLISVLSLVSIGKQEKKPYYKRLEPASKYSTPEEEQDKNANDSYRILWQGFEQDVKNIGNLDSEEGMEKLYNLLEEYTFNIPSAYYYSRPDISLWAHLNTTAAIALCIYKQFEDREDHEIRKICERISHGRYDEDKDGGLFCLVKGDISGIQDFVYDTKTDGAAKALRGKSFYVSYIMNLFAKYIIRNEGVSHSNILYCSGGHFYLLLPAKFMSRIAEYQSYIDRLMYKAHGLKLSILIDGVPVKVSDLNGRNFAPKFEEAGIKIAEKKNRKFYSIINDEEFFIPKDTGREVCPNCGRDINNEFCGFCHSYIELGEKLVKSEYLNLVTIGKVFHNEIKNYNDIFEGLGFRIHFSDSPENGLCYAIKRSNFKKATGILNIPVGMKLDQRGNIIDFDNIADTSQGIKTWGILRGDVDNLGTIFHLGLGENKSIARVATLSSELVKFFSTYLEQILNDEFDYCAAVYAGGDDFCFIGPWDKMPYLAKRIRDSFTSYTSYNPSFTVSMAFDIARDKKFPLYKTAHNAGLNLDSAKAYERDGREKDCLAFCSYRIGWEEFEKLEKVKEIFTNLVEGKGVARALFNTIYQINGLYNIAKEKGGIFKSWRLVYHIARLKERHKNAAELLDELIEQILENKNRLYKNTYLAARWAEFQTRK